MGYKWYDTYHNFCLHFCTRASGIRFWPLGVNFGSVLFDFGIQESTLGPLSQFWAPGAEFVPVGAGFGVCKNIIGTYDNIDKNNAKLRNNIHKKLNHLKITI